MSLSDSTQITDDADLEIRNGAVRWDRSQPQIPVLGSDEINNTPYEARDDKTLLYDRFLRSHVAKDFTYLAKVRHWTASLFGRPSQLGLTEDDFIQLILKDYPRRPDLAVEVMDFSPAKCTRIRCRLEEMSIWLEKPEWSVVRWVHIPLGPSWLSTFVEDEVLMRGPRGFPFKNAGQPEFPYFWAESMSFWSKRAFLRHRDIFKWFSRITSPTNQRIHETLLNSLWRGELTAAVNGYKGQRGRRPDSFWSLARAELPRDLEEDSGQARLADPHFKARTRHDKLDDQMICKHRYYENAQIVKTRLRFYHRSDGFVLSMAPPMGIHYLHRDWFEPSIQRPVSDYITNTFGTLIPQAYHHLSKDISKWHRMDENWLMMYLATEMCSLPSSRLGGPGLQPEEAYFIILQDLKRRRRSEWNSKKAVNLVRELVDFNDEVHLWVQVLERQKLFLNKLGKDAVLLEQYYRENPAEESLLGQGDGPLERIRQASMSVDMRKASMEQTFAESSRVLEALFRLRTIQQNELANSADRSNKAIVAFTVVTIIFLPLNFFTSYFAMLPSYDAQMFWISSAPIGVGVLLISLVFAFRSRVLEWLRSSATLGDKSKED